MTTYYQKKNSRKLHAKINIPKPATIENFSFYWFKIVFYKPQLVLCAELHFQDHTVTAIIWHLNVFHLRIAMHSAPSLPQATYGVNYNNVSKIQTLSCEAKF